MKWKSGNVNVMVATTAFGMGINKPDIRHIVRYGVPESLCTWAQEFGRGGRDGSGATATILYSMATSTQLTSVMIDGGSCLDSRTTTKVAVTICITIPCIQPRIL